MLARSDSRLFSQTDQHGIAGCTPLVAPRPGAQRQAGGLFLGATKRARSRRELQSAQIDGPLIEAGPSGRYNASRVLRRLAAPDWAGNDFVPFPKRCLPGALAPPRTLSSEFELGIPLHPNGGDP